MSIIQEHNSMRIAGLVLCTQGMFEVHIKHTFKPVVCSDIVIVLMLWHMRMNLQSNAFLQAAQQCLLHFSFFFLYPQS